MTFAISEICESKKDVPLEMAKISRRATASSSSSLSFSSPSTSAATSSLVSSYPTSTVSKSTTNINNISNGGKSTELSTKFATTFGHLDDVATFSDPLRLNDSSETPFSTSISRGSSTTATTTGSSHEHKLSTAQTIHITDGGVASLSPPIYQYNKTQAQLIVDEQNRIRAEFFATYDVMTGVRIAATLSGFFGLMVFLIVWKSRSSSNETLKVLKDPKMAAVAAVCMQEEEEREIQEAIVATGMSIYPDEYDAILYRRQRMLSLGNVSAPPMLNRGFRFSSVGGGGYSSLLEPSRRFSYSATSGTGSLGGGRRKSGSESSHILGNNPMGSFGNDDYFIETEDEFECTDYLRNGAHLDDIQNTQKRTDSTKSKCGFLEVPLVGVDSRRSSAITCCSTESSYLERRCSAFTLGLSNFPTTLQHKFSTASRTSSTDNWGYYYPDIQVIQATPKPSPCPSDNSLYDQLQAHAHMSTTVNGEKMTASLQIPSRLASKFSLAQNSGVTIASGIGTGINSTQVEGHKFVQKHSIAYYDPESAQSGRKQKIHSISADTVDIYPYNQTLLESNALIGGTSAVKSAQQSTSPANSQYGFQLTDSPIEESRPGLRGKVAIVELQRLSCAQEQTTLSSIVSDGGITFVNNNSLPYSSSVAPTVTAPTANSSSISIDSTPVSIDKLNGSGSLGTISAKALFNLEKRAPLASLSSFKISSLEYQDSEARSVQEDSVFIDSVADTDEDMRQLSSDSEDISLSDNDSTCMRENLALVSPADTDTPPILRLNQQSVKYPNEKRYSLGATNAIGFSVSRSRHPLLQRHRTISVSSSDRVALIENQLKEFHHGSGNQNPTTTAQFVPLETHFGSIICTNSSPTHPRRAQLLQQYSDPQSLPTTTTTTTEEDTCSTLNTELLGGTGGGSGGTSGDGRGSTICTQHDSLNTVVSFSHYSPLACSNQVNYSVSGGAISLSSAETSITKYKTNETPTQLPRKRFVNDPCTSSTSDSIISTTRQPIICMPSSLKNLILRGTSTAATDKTDSNTATSIAPMVSRSTTNLSLSDTSIRTVMLELPLIKLPIDNNSLEGSNLSDDNDIEGKQSKIEESHDPGLPGTSRKWSKETLF